MNCSNYRLLTWWMIKIEKFSWRRLQKSPVRPNAVMKLPLRKRTAKTCTPNQCNNPEGCIRNAPGFLCIDYGYHRKKRKPNRNGICWQPPLNRRENPFLSRTAPEKIQYVNPAFEQLTGYLRDDAIGKNPRILKSGNHDGFFYKQMWDALLSGKTWHGRITNLKKDGSLL